MTLAEFARRFLSRVEPSPGSSCLIWVGAHDAAGYGNVRIPVALVDRFAGRRWMKAHLVSLVLFRGADPATLEHGHHVCAERGEPFDAKDCVNQYHLVATGAAEHGRIHAARRRVGAGPSRIPGP